MAQDAVIKNLRFARLVLRKPLKVQLPLAMNIKKMTFKKEDVNASCCILMHMPWYGNWAIAGRMLQKLGNND
jgi:hypothetical protein